MLHFSSHCTCSINKNATFNIDIEPIHISIKDSMLCDLPESNLSDKIKKIRFNFNLSMQAFGDIIGNKTSTISNWEHGRRIPSPKTLEKIIKAFDLPKDYFNF